ncbi:GTPase-associated protein 1-related protein [Streptomyces sp. NBC_00078]|uniref:GTPase-associated protein 1-related protein n=1 Tax=unclassified Streptomyces TaxID=2593676 RepID=UPI00224CBD86|nr:GTPase-associated protein 1-related protein [Streptomyces sp. NBC_00078]MCX5424490.1 GTPase-associated protein 1-related protein [Streptomyces sp. NBC_00078]
MAIRELSYVLLRDPDSGADRLTPVTEVPEGVPDDLMQRIISVTHRAAPAVGAALSYTRLPHRAGGGLLCSARPDEESDGLRVDARYEADDAGDADGPRRRWPVDAWRPSTLGGTGDEAFAPDTRCWDEALLVKFAADQGRRVAPFLADVRRLFADPAGRQIVVAERDQETVARWIALACASLPVHYARALTFTTHSADPGVAPQQVVGIGPDTDADLFDRHDVATVTHLFRVHDGLDGRGSPPLSDPWAQVAAWLWREGVVPRPDEPVEGTDAERSGAQVPDTGAPQDPFALLPLVRRALAVRTWHALGDLPEDALREILAAAVRAAEHGRTDDAAQHLAVIARRIAEHRPDAVQPLAAALARSRVRAADPQDVVPALEACTDLPLDEGTWRTLRSELGPPPEDELRKMLRYPFDAWEKPLRAVLAGGGDRSSALDEAVDKIAGALSSPEARRACADAVALLAAVNHGGLVRRVLDRLARDLTDRRVRALRDLAASYGDWLRPYLDGAPLVIRLAVSAANLKHLHRLEGADLWVQLAKRHLDGQVSDGSTLRIMWALVWPQNGFPPNSDQSRVTEVCPPRLIVEEAMEIRLTHWLRHPSAPDQSLVDFARASARSPRYNRSERATAQLIVLTWDFAHRNESVQRVMEHLPTLEHQARGLGSVLQDAIDRWLASGLAQLGPEELRRSRALRYLATGHVGRLRHYRAAVADAQGALEPAALCEPRRVAALFVVWRSDQEGATGGWRDTAEDLLHDVIGSVLPQLGERGNDEVLAFLKRDVGEDWVRAWTEWRRRLR